MSERIVISPTSRQEGHAELVMEVDDEGIVTKGRYFSITPVRGLEKMVAGKAPETAPVMCQRICGVCPIPHTLASAEAVDDSLDIEVPKAGQLLRELILMAHDVNSHAIHHFLIATDFVPENLMATAINSVSEIRKNVQTVVDVVAGEGIHPSDVRIGGMADNISELARKRLYARLKQLKPKVKCTCSKTGCKKKYCACFSNSIFCEGCDCKDCENKPPNEDIKNNFDSNNDNGNALKQDNIEKINYDKKEMSNQKTQRVICNCTKSYCMKKYCECFKQSLNCNSLCRCIECKNKNYNNNCYNSLNNPSYSNNFYNYALNNSINNNININNNYSEVHNILPSFGKSIDYNNPINFQSEAFGIFIKKDKLKIEGRNINLNIVNNNNMNKDDNDNDNGEKIDKNNIKDLNETPKFSNKKRLRAKNENSGDMKTCPTTNSSKRRKKGVSVVNKNIKKKRLQLN